MIALYGGTFDPVHLGHISVARQTSELLGDTQVRLLLSARPSHRGSTGADVEHRWQMLKLACQYDALLLPDRREIDRAGPSYAVLTLETLRDAHPDETLCWIVGQDSFATLATWYRWEALFELAHFVVVPRPGVRQTFPDALERAVRPRLASTFEVLASERAGRVWLTNLATPDVSSTAIRQYIGEGRPLDALVGRKVARYLSLHGLYEPRRSGAPA